MSSPVPFFDGHNDVLLRLFNKHTDGVERLFLDGENDGQLDFPRALKGGFGGACSRSLSRPRTTSATSTN